MINNEKDMLNESENISEAISIANVKQKTEVIAKTVNFTKNLLINNPKNLLRFLLCSKNYQVRFILVTVPPLDLCFLLVIYCVCVRIIVCDSYLYSY